MKHYNLEDRKRAQELRRELVVTLRGRGETFKAIGYALGITPNGARELFARSERRKRQAAMINEALGNIGLTSDDVRRICGRP